jgi:hypothetical protein
LAAATAARCVRIATGICREDLARGNSNSTIGSAAPDEGYARLSPVENGHL